MERHGGARFGADRRGVAGTAWHGKAGLGSARQALIGKIDDLLR